MTAARVWQVTKLSLFGLSADSLIRSCRTSIITTYSAIMSLKQLSSRCLNGLLRQVSSAAASAEQGSQQQCGRHNALFQQLASGMRGDAQRHYSQVFQPSRLYPKQHTTAEAYAFWGLIGLNVATTVAAKVGPPEVQQAILQHCRASVEAVADGRLYTLLTSSVCHTSAVHCAMNLLMLVMYRRVQPLTAREVSVQHCRLILYEAAAAAAVHQGTVLPSIVSMACHGLL
jgi:hypothetical protein